VVDEQSFRERTTALLATDYMLSSDRNFIYLMSLVWGLGAHYLWTDPNMQQSMPVLDSTRDEIIRAMNSAYFQVISKPDLAAVQVSILLGSFHLFNGKPYLGLGILGSGIKCAQAISLLREARHCGITSFEAQENSRIWWALEIFDK
jgi:hypothetical protein